MSEPIAQLHEANVPRWAVAGLAATALVLAGCTVGHESPGRAPATVEQSVDGMQILPGFDAAHVQKLLPGTWQYMPGATPVPSGLAIHHTGEAILTNPDSGRAPVAPHYIPNPPVNVYGTRLSISHGSDVGIAAHLNDIHGAATLSFHSKPPIRYDERLERQPGVDVTVDASHATVTVYGDPADPDAKPQTVSLDLRKDSQQADVTVAQEGSKLIATVDGQRASLDAKPFSGEVWFGMDAPEDGGSYSVAGLDAYPIGGDQVSAVDMSHYYDNVHTDPNGLASLATKHDPHKLVGTAVDLPVLMAYPNVAKFYFQNFNEVETETLAKFQALQPEKGHYEWGELDATVDLASKHHQTVRGHALVFGEANPQWLYDALKNAGRDKAIKIMNDHITTVMTRYDGKHGHGEIKYWDVDNEFFDADNLGQLNQQNVWVKAIGDDAPIIALKTALAANPNAIVTINEYSMEGDNDQWPGMQNLMLRIKAAGLDTSRIQIGFQFHDDEQTLADQDDMNILYSGELASRFRWIKDEGFYGGRVSELSVALTQGEGTPEDPARQAKVYALAYGLSDDFNMWGAVSGPFYFTSERDSNGMMYYGDDAPTYLKSGAIVPRPAWAALLKAAASN